LFPEVSARLSSGALAFCGRRAELARAAPSDPRRSLINQNLATKGALKDLIEALNPPFFGAFPTKRGSPPESLETRPSDSRSGSGLEKPCGVVNEPSNLRCSPYPDIHRI
jgi:hypothetical protein